MTIKKKKQIKKKNTAKKKIGFLSRDILSKKRAYCILGSFAVMFVVCVVLSSKSIERIADSIPGSSKSVSQLRLEKVITDMTEGHPITAMLPYIFQQDQLTATYLVSIAKKESNWGKRAPKKDGEDCYNYWGFKGEGSRGMALGHGCFASPEEAVTTVSARIDQLTQEYERETPRQMVVWKCGYSCAGQNQASVQKWIRDVSYYNEEIAMANN